MTVSTWILLLVPASVSISLVCDKWRCPDSYKSDRWCDVDCMTSFCNFDMSQEFDSSTNRGESDCYEYCTIDLGCDAAKLGDGVCDEACSSAECGYDWGDCGYCAFECFQSSLEDDTCDESCCVSSCLFDVSVCQECAPGCSRNLLENEECDEECRNPDCNYDNQRCSMTENLCSEGCLEHIKHDGKCDSECNNSSCDFDEGDCYCSQGCFNTASDGQCDTECESMECEFDFGDCGYCSKDCFESDLGDGECKSECYTAECEWDGGDCQCSEECFLEDLGQCKPECLNPKCKYDEFPDMPVCEDAVLKSLALFTHIINAKFTTQVSLDECLQTGCTIEELNSALEPCSEDCCITSCANKACGFYLGRCSSKECGEDCEICEDGGSCLRCNSDKFQFLGSCFSECPVGTQPQSFSFFENKNFCVPFTEDSTADSPKQYYVDTRTDGSYGRGTSDDPFSSISIALSSLYTEYSEIVLMSEGPFELTKTPEDYVLSSLLEDLSSPLIKSQFDPKSISISFSSSSSASSSTSTTETYATLSVAKASEFIFFDIQFDFKVSNVVIEGANIFPECTGDMYCDYCPLSYNLREETLNDRDEILEEGEYFAGCIDYHYKDLFFIRREGNLLLENVKLENLRMELYSLIRSSGGNVELKNVEFKNIRTMSEDFSWAILFEGCSDSYNCGDFSYVNGTVSLLNNGYELSDSKKLTGFLCAPFARNVLIENIEFSYNIVNSGTGNYYPLINVNIFYTFSIKQCKFQKNLLNDGIVYIDAKLLEFEYSVDDNDRIEQLLIDHIIFEDIEISDCYAERIAFICIRYKKTLQNIYFDSIRFYNNFSQKELIFIHNEKFLEEYKEDFFMPAEINEVKKYAYYKKRTLHMSNITVYENNIGSNSVLHTYQMMNIRMQNFNITNNIANNNTANVILNQFIEGPGVYMERNLEEFSTIDCNYLMMVDMCYNTEIDSSIVHNNYCKYSTPSIVIHNQDTFKMTNSSLTQNTGSSANWPTSLYLSGNSTFLIDSSVFSNNRNNQGAGSIQAYGSNLDLEMRSSEVSDNQSAFGPELEITARSLRMNNVTLHRNVNLFSDKGGLLFESTLVSSSVKIVDCLFSENETPQGGEATLTLAGSQETAYTILIEVSGTTFSHNKAATYNSVFHTYDSVYLDPQSYFENCTFSNNQVGIAGNIILEQRTGTIEFRNCTFVDNISAEGAGLGAVLLFRSLVDYGIIYLTGSTISRNKGVSVIHYSKDVYLKTIVTRECEFSLNQGNSLYLAYSIWEDFDSVFDSNHQDNGGSAFLLSDDSTANLTGTRFVSNSGNTGGAGIVMMKSIISIDKCEFSYNSAESMGGALYAEQDSQIAIYNSRFFGNFADKGSAIMVLACDMAAPVIDGCVFFENSSRREGTILVQIGDLIYRNSEMFGNVAETGGSGISITTGKALIYKSDFHDQLSPLGAYLCSNTDSEVSLDSCSFRSGKSEGSGGAVHVTFTNLTVTSCTFEDLEASFGGAIHLYYSSKLDLRNSSFLNIRTTSEGGSISSFESDLYIRKSEFVRYSQSAVFLDSPLNVEISSSSFSFGTSEHGGAINCKDCNRLSIHNSTFHDLYATHGGAVYLYSHTGPGSETLQITDSTFTRNRAKQGGSIFANSVNLSLESCVFDSNSAYDSSIDEFVGTIENGRGGAALLLCKEASNCDISVTSSSFVNNNATYNGGAICWEDARPSLSSNFFYSNNALYGSNISSFPMKVMQVDTNGQLVQYTRRLQESPVAGTVSSVASGQAIRSIAFAVVDHYDQIVTTDNLNVLSASGSEGASVSGTTQVSSVKGIGNFTDLIVSAEPGSSVSISVTSDRIDAYNAETANDGWTYYSKVSLIIELRECELGEATVGVECHLCEEGTYSLSPSDTACMDCPDSKAFCYGGSEVTPKPKYWRSSKFSSVFWECPNPDACKGGEISGNLTVSYTGRCAKGYKGNMCQSCEVGYSRGAPNSCTLCPGEGESLGILLLIFLVIVIILTILVKAAINSAYETKALHSVYIKILINYLQLVVIITSFNLKWPELGVKFFNVHEAAGSIIEQLFSFDCYLESDDNPDDVYFNKLVILSVVPAIAGLISVGVWTIISLVKRNTSYLKEELVATLVILLFLLHPVIIQSMFSSMNCTEIEDGDLWLKDNLDIKCWDTTHLFYVLVTSLPSIFIWGVFVPAFCLIVLAKNKRRLHNLKIRKKFGFLFNGYTKKGYYWEFVIVYRKIIIICCSVFIDDSSISTRALTVMLILIIGLVLQKKYKPYSEEVLNQMEVRSIVSSTITIYCGLYFLSQDLDEVSKLFLFVVIVGVNVYFLSIWSAKMFGAGIAVLAKKSRFIRRYFLKTARDGYPDDLFNLKEEEDHVVGRKNEKYYSMVQTNRRAPTQRKQHEWRNMRDLFLDVINRNIEEQTFSVVSFGNEEDSQAIRLIAKDFLNFENDRLDNYQDSSNLYINTC